MRRRRSQTLKPSRIIEVGEALYGHRWRAGLAQDLAVSDRTVRRWETGEIRPPEGVSRRLDELIDLRIGSLYAVKNGGAGVGVDVGVGAGVGRDGDKDTKRR